MSLIYLTAWVITAIIFISPFILLFFIIKAVIKSIKRRKKKEQPENEWKSEWVWNEETKLWEHPLSAKSDTTYQYTRENIPTETEAKCTEQNTKKEAYCNTEQTTATGPKIIYTYNKPELKFEDIERTTGEELDFKAAYQRKPLFTKNEWQNYKKLRDIAEIRGFVICPKVRLFDLVEPRHDKKKKLTYRYKIQAKHVDFVICDKNMNIKAILELDDSSHYDPDRIKRDNFVNTILLSTGYTVIHTKYIENRIFDLI